MGSTTRAAWRPWSVDDQAALLDGLRRGHPPAHLCLVLDRDPDDVRRRIATLLGDVASPLVAEPTAELDLLWLRVRSTGAAPTPLTVDQLVHAWEGLSGIALTPGQRAEFATDDAVPPLLDLGRWALLASAAAVVDDGILDLIEWREAARALDVRAALPQDDPAGASLRALLDAVVTDIAPPGPRRALRRHLRLDDRGDVTAAPAAGDADRRDRRLGTVDACRAGGVPGRPAAVLRERLAEPGTVRGLTVTLGGGPGIAMTLAMLGGRDEMDALRLAGRLMTPWNHPPNLGRGVAVRSRT